MALSWLGLFLLAWIIGCFMYLMGNTFSPSIQAYFGLPVVVASLFTLACWLLAQGRW